MADTADPDRHSGEVVASPVPTPKGFLARTLAELGLVSLYHSSPDVKLLCAQRFFRMFAYGSSTLVLVAYLNALAITKAQIGLFMSMTLAGDVCVSFVLTMFADGVGRKATLAMGALLMTMSGIVFATCQSFWLLLAAAVLGVITPSGNEIGPFRAIEDSVVAHLTASSTRGDIYAWFNLLAKAGTALGMITCGWGIHVLTNSLGWSHVDAYRSVFLLYAGVGLVKILLVLSMSSRVESETKVDISRPKKHATQSGGETQPLLTNGDGQAGPEPELAEPKPSGIRSFLPNISKESRVIMVNLCILFAINSFSSGLAQMSWVTYFFQWKYNIEEGRLGTIFFAANLCSAASVIVASSLAKRFGNVNIMVFTHLPSSIFMALIGIPDDVYLSLLFLFLRDSTKSMNVGPRSAFLAAIVLPHERTAMIGLINVTKTLAQTVGPSITGVLAERNLFWVAFLCAGAGKVVYDLGLLLMFRNHERESAERQRIAAERRAEDEEGRPVTDSD